MQTILGAAFQSYYAANYSFVNLGQYFWLSDFLAFTESKKMRKDLNSFKFVTNFGHCWPYFGKTGALLFLPLSQNINLLRHASNAHHHLDRISTRIGNTRKVFHELWTTN